MTHKKTLLLDGHVHIYQHFDLVQAFEGGVNNLLRAAKKMKAASASTDTVPVLLLSERHDCNFFKQALESTLQQEHEGYSFHETDESESLMVKKGDTPYMYIIAGRQIVTCEGLEIISILTNLYIKDRSKTTHQVVNIVNENNGFPVINWAPGKWFFARGKVVESLIDTFDPSTLLLGDTTLRTTLWPLPQLMKKANGRGFKIIAGSDPLPFKKEEKIIGKYGFVLEGQFDENKPAASIRSLLKHGNEKLTLIGNRNDPLTFVKRQTKIMVL